MKVKRYESNDERAILTALCVHDEVLGRIYHKIGKETRPFKGRWSNLVAQWCFHHYKKFQRAPRSAIQGAFDRFAAETQDNETIELVEAFLGSLSEDYKGLAREMNDKYVIDLAGEYFERIKLERLSESIQEALERNDLEEAKVKQSEFETIDFSANAHSYPFDDEEMRSSLYYYEEDRSLIHFPGALDRFLSPYFARDGFISFVGPEKRGKSYWLMQVVWQALRQKRKVLYYCFGDMSKEEAAMRLYTRAARLPIKREILSIPQEIQVNGRQFDVISEEWEYPALSMKALRETKRRLCLATGTDQPNIRFLVAGGGVMTASQIEQDVKRFGARDWPPDVVVIDYADLLEPESHTLKQDKRHQIDATWQIMRRTALESHCLMVTASQAATSAYSGWLIRKGDFSEDKRKNAHVTGMLGINQTAEEKVVGVYRLNWSLLRGGHWSENQVVWTAGNLAISNPCITSAFVRYTRQTEAAEDNSSEQGQE